MTTQQSLSTALKKMVITECRVSNVEPHQIPDEAQVIGAQDGVQLDSLDAVEIVTSMERNFGLKADSMGPMKNVFKSYRDFTNYVAKNAPPEKVEAFIQKYS